MYGRVAGVGEVGRRVDHERPREHRQAPPPTPPRGRRPSAAPSRSTDRSRRRDHDRAPRRRERRRDLVDGEPAIRVEHLGDLRREGRRRHDDVRGRAVGHHLPLGEHDHAIGGRAPRTRRRGWPPPPARPSAASSRRSAVSRSLASWSRPRVGSSKQHQPRRGRQLHGEHQAQALALGEVARVLVVGEIGHDPLEQPAAGPRRSTGLAVGLVALLGDGGEVQQVRRRLRHERHRGPAIVGHRMPVDRPPIRPGDDRRGGAPRAATTCPSRCGP